MTGIINEDNYQLDKFVPFIYLKVVDLPHFSTHPLLASILQVKN